MPKDLTPTETTSVKRLDDDADRLADFTVPDGGLQPRPPVWEYDDSVGTAFARPDPERNPPASGRGQAARMPVDFLALNKARTARRACLAGFHGTR